MRSFIPNAAMVHTHSFGGTTDDNRADSSNSGIVRSPTNPIVLIDDEVVKISAILLHPSSTRECADKMDVANIANSDNLDLQSKARSTLKPGDIAVIYACELSEIKGKFDPLKAQALGLKPGPKYRELQLGKSVKSDRLDIMVS